MVRAVFTVQDSLVSTRENGLVGLNDLQLVNTGGGLTLFAAARGGGYVTGFDVGSSVGDTDQAGFWQIGTQYLQLESTDLVFHDGAGGPRLYMAGFANNGLRGLRLDDDGQGPLFDGQAAVSSAGQNLGLITEMELFGTSDQGLAAMRGGGIVNVSFGAGNSLNVSQINEGPALDNARASDLLTTTHNGQSFAFVSYGAENTVAMYRQLANGNMSFVAKVDSNDGLWVDRPSALSVTTAADGGLYVVVAASGTDSLSVLSVTNSGLSVVDHVIDTRDTRFDNASHVTSVTLGGQSYVVAAGADSGLSLFVMLPGGRLQHVETFEATIEAPLNGVTALEAMAIPGGIRVWASTEGAPYLSEFSVSLHNLGIATAANDAGGTTLGSSRSDVLTGGAGADFVSAGGGDDILMDGTGQDTLRGGSGTDTFVLTRDGSHDVISDFNPTQDVLDLSSFGTLGGAGDLTISARSWGALIQFGNETIEVRSHNGSSLNATDLSGAILHGGRVEVDVTLYPDPGTYEPEPDPEPGDPNAGGGSPAGQTQMPGAVPVYEGSHAMPGVALNLGSANTIGNAASNLIQTFGASDYIFGLFGNDTIQSGNGNDSVSGDDGNDVIDSGNGSDVVMGGNGWDTITAGSGFDTIVAGTGADFVRAGFGNDVITGGQGYDVLYGDAGNDSIWGGPTADRLYGGLGNDFISAGINFSITVDGLWGNEGNDTLFGDAGFDFLDGGTGDDTLDGGAQADNLFGRAGEDLLLGSGGLDRLFGGAGNDRLYGGEGNDGHFGEWGNDTMWGGSGTDRFFGGPGNDLIDGGAGNDTVYAGSGFDTIIGGAGDDRLLGKFNADTFVFAEFHGHDTIVDFNAENPIERIDLSGMININHFSTVSALFTQMGNDVMINTGEASSIRLTGVHIADLDSTDFLF